ncbi:SMP-30/gluconolactonase/LRE family protein [Klebsiella pneumoniae]|uniref:SMP-30/gluconolactonase/LRE family protein n=1 Tax=Klebsiella pneumoniae TaxID=573 RepID=UPI0003BF1C5D|nr:drp35 [Klebsiella pneumoniae UCICRE 6]
MNGLNHNALTRSAVPIPACERSLQTVEAQPYFSVSQASLVLEGIVFDRNNNLLFVDVATGRVFKLTPERQLSIVLKENTFGASGLAVHKDGRIFIASVGDMQRGSVRAIEPNGTGEQMIVAPDAGFLVNDLVFDNQGGFYFTDSRGNSADPQGGVFYVSPNVGSIHAILPGLAVGNGIAIDPDGTQIWATEHSKNRLHRVRLSDATTVAPFGSVVTYQFTGPAPDGARVDSEGNVYVAISGQGRVMVFSGVLFNVTPSIKSRTMDLKIQQQLSNFVTTETGVNNSPTLIKRDVTTEVSLADGDIILLGGLAEQKDSKASSGWSFFGSRTSESNKTDIMVMLQVRKVDRSRATPRSAARSGELFRDNLNSYSFHFQRYG